MAAQRQAATILFARWREQLETSFLPRRARSLGMWGALEELIALAEGWLRSGGQLRPAIDPDDGGHGTAMLPDVAAETERLIRSDALLARQSLLRDVLAETAHRLTSKPDDGSVRDVLAQLQALTAATSRSSYIADAFRELGRLVAEDASNLEKLLQLTDSAVSELRSLGWTENGLAEAAVEARKAWADPVEAVRALSEFVLTPAQSFTCFVSLTLPQQRPLFPVDDRSFLVVDELPVDVARVGRPMKRGSYARVELFAFDPVGAALLAYRRVLATIGALTVSLPASRIDVASDVVGVIVGPHLRGCEVQERLLEDKRTARPDEVLRIISSSWKASATPAADPLHDAIRIRHRALVASDTESRLLLLWSALERLTSGARGFKAALGAAKELVPAAVTFGKLRRDVSDLAAAVEQVVANEKRAQLLGLVGHAETRVDRERVLEYLLGDAAELGKLTVLFETEQPLLAYRCRSLWQDLGAGAAGRRGKAIVEYHTRSHQRVAWQVGRIYRARNRIAHVGVGPERVRDLVGHAHFYLTQLIAICVHYGERSALPPQDLLVRRLGQYQAFLLLVGRGEERFQLAKNLMRPSVAMGAS